MQEPISTALPAAAATELGPEAVRGRLPAPTLWEQLIGIFTAPTALFQRLARTPRWGQAFWAMIIVGWFMMIFWGLKVDVEALQRPILEQNSQLTASQVNQAIGVSGRFILPMAIVSIVVRSLLAVLALGVVFWLFALSTGETKKPSFLHAMSASTVPNLVLLPYWLMIGVLCMTKEVGARIPERLAPSGLAYYLRPENPRLYGLAAQVDPFVIAYFVMIFFALRYTLRMKVGDAVVGTFLTVLLTVAWKVYFWV